MNQLDLFAPKRELFSLSLDPVVDKLLSENSPVAIGVSGGKDSSVAAWATINHLDKIGHTGPRILIHSDLGRIEWADSLPTCERLAKRLNVELVTVRRPAGGMVERWMSRWDANVERYRDLSCVKLILPWSTPSMRFCTSELKTAIICRYLVNRFGAIIDVDQRHRAPSTSIVSVSGIRRQESAMRAKKPVFAWQAKLLSNTRKVEGLDWNAILDWTLEEVWACHEINGLPIHEAYTAYGSSRVSCCFCIMSALEDLIKAALCPGNEDVYRELCELEIISTFSFQEKQWLCDIAPKLLTEDQRERLVVAKQMARRREQAEARIPDHLLFEEGWPNVMPTYKEAVMLAEVRAEVAASARISVWMTDPETILMRYEELFKLKAKKAAFEAETIIRRVRKAELKQHSQKYLTN